MKSTDDRIAWFLVLFFGLPPLGFLIATEVMAPGMIPLELWVGLLTSLVTGAVALLCTMRAKQDGWIGPWWRYLLSSMLHTFFVISLVSFIFILWFQKGAYLPMYLFFLGAAAGPGLWIGFLWTRYVPYDPNARSLPM